MLSVVSGILQFVAKFDYFVTDILHRDVPSMLQVVAVATIISLLCVVSALLILSC